MEGFPSHKAYMHILLTMTVYTASGMLTNPPPNVILRDHSVASPRRPEGRSRPIEFPLSPLSVLLCTFGDLRVKRGVDQICVGRR